MNGTATAVQPKKAAAENHVAARRNLDQAIERSEAEKKAGAAIAPIYADILIEGHKVGHVVSDGYRQLAWSFIPMYPGRRELRTTFATDSDRAANLEATVPAWCGSEYQFGPFRTAGEICAASYEPDDTFRPGRGARLVDLAEFCRAKIEAAESDGVTIDDGNVVDLIADSAEASLEDIRAALVVAGLAPRFRRATRPRMCDIEYRGIPESEQWQQTGIVLRMNGAESTQLDLRLDIANHSPTGFAWGYHGSGPAQLALAILADTLEDNFQTYRLHQAFKDDVIAKLEPGPWTITQADVRAWYAARWSS